MLRKILSKVNIKDLLNNLHLQKFFYEAFFQSESAAKYYIF